MTFLSSAYSTWGLLAIAWVLVWVVYTFSVRGTKLRYRCRTIMRPCWYMAPIYFAVDVPVSLAEGNVFYAVLNVYNAWWTYREVKAFFESDEDDWWKGRKKKVAAWFKQKLESAPRLRVPQLAPLPTGV